jgi:aspartyl aminopeptidase
MFLLSSCEKIEEAVISPDGNVTAEVISSTEAAATDANTTYIKVHEKYSSSKYIIFGGANYGAEITVSWIDSRNLTVVCENCSALQRRVKDEDKWHKISIHYDLR